MRNILNENSDSVAFLASSTHTSTVFTLKRIIVKIIILHSSYRVNAIISIRFFCTLFLLWIRKKSREQFLGCEWTKFLNVFPTCIAPMNDRNKAC